MIGHMPAARSSFRVYPVNSLLQVRGYGKGRVFELEFLARAAWAGLPVNLIELPVRSGVTARPLIPGGPGTKLVLLRLCLRNLNPWPFQRRFNLLPGEVTLTWRNILAWRSSIHARATRRLATAPRVSAGAKCARKMPD